MTRGSAVTRRSSAASRGAHAFRSAGSGLLAGGAHRTAATIRASSERWPSPRARLGTSEGAPRPLPRARPPGAGGRGRPTGARQVRPGCLLRRPGPLSRPRPGQPGPGRRTPGHVVTVSASIITFRNFRPEGTSRRRSQPKCNRHFGLGCIKTAYCPLWLWLTSILMSVCVQNVGG
jgi:hypothetical protein